MPDYVDGYGKDCFAYFSCREAIKYNIFNKFEQKIKACFVEVSPLDHAKCTNCTLDFQYYPTRDRLHGSKNLKDIRPWLILTYASYEEPGAEPCLYGFADGRACPPARKAVAGER
jgi:hypothetical protein